MHDSGALQACSRYARELRSDLPPQLFDRRPSRLLWLPAHLAVIAAASTALLATEVHWGWRILLSATIGHSYGCLMFLAHEILHGTVVKNRHLQNWLSGLCMLPYCIGPAHWKAWHNQAHHGHTTVSGTDPDSFGNVTMFMNNRVARFTLTFAPGSGYWRSWLFLGFWFSFHAVVTLFVHSAQYDYWAPARRRREIGLFFLMAGFWAGVLALAGPWNFLFLYPLPMVVANILQMSYIATNHLLCDETSDVNDPLANSLSVSVPGWLGWLHLNFGNHIEHHIFPYMNPQNSPAVRAAIENRYGGRYRALPILKAIQLLYRTPPVHLSQKELVDLNRGDVYSTLGASGEPPRKIDQVAVPVRPRRRRPAAIRLHQTTDAPSTSDDSATSSATRPTGEPVELPEASPRRRAA